MEEIKIDAELLELRSLLNFISDISFRYSIFKEKFPISSLDLEGKKQLIKVYRDLVTELKNFLSKGGSDDQNC